jgi:hypothetical protein
MYACKEGSKHAYEQFTIQRRIYMDGWMFISSTVTADSEIYFKVLPKYHICIHTFASIQPNPSLRFTSCVSPFHSNNKYFRYHHCLYNTFFLKQGDYTHLLCTFGAQHHTREDAILLPNTNTLLSLRRETCDWKKSHSKNPSSLKSSVFPKGRAKLAAYKQPKMQCRKGRSLNLFLNCIRNGIVIFSFTFLLLLKFQVNKWTH